VTAEGIFISDIAVHPLNASEPILSTLSEMVTLVSLTQPANIEGLIDVNFVGRGREVRVAQSSQSRESSRPSA